MRADDSGQELPKNLSPKVKGRRVRLRQRPERALLCSAPIGGTQAPRHRFADCGPGQTSHSGVVVFGMKYPLLSGVVLRGSIWRVKPQQSRR